MGLIDSLIAEDIPLEEEQIREHLDKRILVLNEEISIDVLERCSLYILKWNAEDKNIPVEKRKPIWLY